MPVVETVGSVGGGGQLNIPTIPDAWAIAVSSASRRLVRAAADAETIVKALPNKT